MLWDNPVMLETYGRWSWEAGKAKGRQNSNVQRSEQNAKITFWNISFGVGLCISSSNEGRGTCRR
jgi:hypothetical protein